MKKRRVLRLLLEFVRDFLRDRRITITIDGYTTAERSVNVDIPQDSSLSLILYLFYNANLLEACDDIKLRTSFTGFVDDVNILTYEESMKRNCRVLDEIYDRCEQWSKTHGIKFSKTKHKLIHFTRTSKWFNMNASVELTKHQIDSKSDIRVLKVQLDFKLRWAAHMRHVEAKLVIRQKALQTIIESTWGPSMATGKQIYFAVTRSLLSHEAVIYMVHATEGEGSSERSERQAEINTRKSIATDYRRLSCNINRDSTSRNKHDVDRYSSM